MKYKLFAFFVILILLAGTTNTAFADDPTPEKEGDGGESAFPAKNESNFQVLKVETSTDFTPKLTPVLANGNFEAGSNGWTEFSSGGVYPIIGIPNFLTPHSGSWLAWLGGEYSATTRIGQDNLPITSPTNLLLYYWIASEDDNCINADWGNISVWVDGEGSYPIHTWRLCSANNTNGWAELNYDLSSFSGESVDLSIVAVTNASLNSNLFIDDVSFYRTFADVPNGGFADNHIQSIYNAGITGGCATSPVAKYCPGGTVTRAQMAVFLMKGINGSSYTPPPPTGTVFADVPTNGFAAGFIEAFSGAGITGGCTTSPANYCPNGLVSRAQMAVFLLKAKHGSSYTPPPATGTMFSDIPSNAFAAAWIEQLATEGITGGCGGGNYCPNNSVTRAQMAVFIQKTFNLPLP